MEALSRFNSEIDEFLDSKAALFMESDAECINVKQMDARERLISDLNNLISGLQNRVGSLTKALETAQATHETDIKAADRVVRRLKHEQETPWTAVVRGRSRPTRIVSTARVQYTPPAPLAKHSKIKFTDSIWIDAIRVKSFDDVVKDGNLYYVESADHFAVYINNMMLRGNIGTIYTEEKNPEKIKDCKFAGSCVKRDNCDYYHDPKEFPGSKDRRNFVAGSWMYTPPGASFKNRQRTRRFGSREHMDVDLVGLQPDEVVRFRDQTIHDVLCAIILCEKYRQN